MYKQFEKLRRMPEKRTEKSIFATETCVLGDSKNHARLLLDHVREPSFAFFFLWKWVIVEIFKGGWKGHNWACW